MFIKNYKALILVGGFGSRLRPLTYTIPKPLVPFENIPILERQVEALSKVGVEEIVLAMNYKYNIIENNVKEYGRKYNVKLIMSLENEPLGTAGPIALARKYLKNSLFFVLNSDIICDFPLKEMIDFHLKNDKIGTLLVTEVRDPFNFGVIKSNNKGEIEAFIEKPKEFISNLINAGIYFFSEKIFDFLEERPSSIEKEVFPILADQRLLQIYNLEGIWSDIGTVKGYLNGQKLFLRNNPNFKNNVVIGKNVKIGKNVLLKNCAIFDNTVIEDNVIISDSIVGSNCTIKENSSLIDFSILGDNTEFFN